MNTKEIVNTFMIRIELAGLPFALFNLYLYEDHIQVMLAEETGLGCWVMDESNYYNTRGYSVWSEELKTLQDICDWITKVLEYQQEFNKEFGL